MVASIPFAIFAVCVLLYLVLSVLTDRVCDFIEESRAKGQGMRTDP